MKPEKFMQAMGKISPEIIEELSEEESEAPATKKKAFKFTWKKSIAIAACFVCIIAITIMIPIIKSQTNYSFSNDGEKNIADEVIDNESQTKDSLSNDGENNLANEVIDNRPFSMLSMFVYGDTLYFGNPNDNYYLYSCNINNPSETIKKIGNEIKSSYPVTDGENVYYITGSGDEKICSVNLSGEDLKILYEDKDVDPYQNYTNFSSLSVYENKLYFTLQYPTYENNSTEHLYCCLMCYDIDTKKTTTLKQFELIGQFLNCTPITYTIDNDIIYFSHENLYTCNLDGTNEKILAETQNHDLISYPQIKNGKLYYQIEDFSKTDSDRMAFVRSDLDGNNKVSTDIISNASPSYKLSVLDNGCVVSYVYDHGLSLIDIDKSSVIFSYQDLVPEYYLTVGNKIFALKRYKSFGMYEDGNVEYIVVNKNATSSN